MMKALSKRILAASIAVLCFGVMTSAASPPPLTPIQQLFILKEMKPDMDRVGIIWKEGSPQHDDLMPMVQRASASTEVQSFVAYVNDVKDVASSYRTLKRKHKVDALWILENDGTVNDDVARDFLVETATKDGIPILAPSEDWVDAGAPVTLREVSGDIQIVVNQAAAAATSLSIPDEYDTQYLTSR